MRRPLHSEVWRMKQVKQITSNILISEKGSGLVLALMVLLVLSALGSALGFVTVGSFRLSDTNQDINSAYYIAEAGANMAYEEIKKAAQDGYEDPASVSSGTFYNKVQPTITEFKKEYSNSFELQSGEKPTATVTISGPVGEGEERQYTITSTGEVAGRERTVEKPFTVTWQDKLSENPFGLPKDAAVIFEEEINYGNNNEVKIEGKIIGNVNAIENDTNNTSFTVEREPLDWELYSSVGEESLELTTVNTVGDWVIDTNGKTLNYKVNSFDFKKDIITVTGGGTVNIFLETPFNNSSFDNNNNITDGIEGKLNIIYTGNQQIVLGNGAVGEFVLFAPNASVVLGNGSSIIGSIIAKKVSFDQNSKIQYPEGMRYDFPFETTSDSEEHETELVKTTSAIEQ